MTMKRKTMKDIDEDLHKLEAQVKTLSEEIRERIAYTVENEALRKCQALSDSLDKRIDGRFRTAFLFAGALLALLSAFGFFGLRFFISDAVDDVLDKGTLARITTASNKAEAELEKIITFRRAAEDCPLIVLQTDYGTKSYYMGRLKGVIYDINPKARIDIITADVEDFDVINAAFTLWRASRFYPRGTIFVVVTNPGGITTEMIIVETENGHIYIGHDNGCFDLVVQHYGHTATYRIASPELTPPRFRDLFGGVDTFGPTAAQISLGFKIEDAGPKCDAYTPKLPYIQHTVSRNRIVGSVMDVDKYGNATTNIMEEDLEQAGIRISQVCNMQLDNHPKKLEIPFKRTYGNVSKGEPVLLLYEGMVQLALNEDSFAAKHEVKRGTAVEISR